MANSLPIHEKFLTDDGFVSTAWIGYFQSLEDNGVQDIINQEITQLLGGNITNNISSGDSFSSTVSNPGKAINTLEIESLLTDRRTEQKKNEDDKLIAIIGGEKVKTKEDENFRIGDLMFANF